MKLVAWLLGLLVLVVTGAVVFVWSGAFNIAADEPHWPLTAWLMETARDRSIAARASDVIVPALEDESQIRGGAGNYDAMCAGCHLKPGVERTEAGAGLYPPPPDLTKRRADDAARAFWIIKHGIKMSGMPAWGKSMGDEYIWGMVAFIQQLPDLSRYRYDELVEASGGHQHGDAEAVPQEKNTDADDHSRAPPHQH